MNIKGATSYPQREEKGKMKTIKELAEICGVSKTAINARLKSLNIIAEKDATGTKIINEEDAKRIIEDFERTRTRKDKAPETPKSTNDNMIEILTEQLRAKDRQIEELQRIVNQEQQLRLFADQRLLALEEKQNEPEQPGEDEPQQEEKTGRKWWNFFK